jgi:hypothetical protein
MNFEIDADGAHCLEKKKTILYIDAAGANSQNNLEV